MATCTTMTARDPFPRAPTPRPASSSFRLIAEPSSYQSLNSPIVTSPMRQEPFSQVDSEWPLINIISPSTASHHSLCSDTENEFRTPRLALLTSELGDEAEEFNKLISPSAPIPQPGDELLYDIMTEEKPDEPFFNHQFQAILARMKQEMKDISLSIWGCPASHRLGSDLHALKQHAVQLSEFEPSRTRTIAFVGESGVGKCGVINALLDQPHFNHINCGSSRSTSIVTEYRFRSHHYNEPFAIEVDFAATLEIKELIEQLLKSVHAYHEPAFRDIDNETERQDTRYRSERAWTTLHSMFRNRAVFTQEFVLNYPSDSEISLVDMLHQWAIEFLLDRPDGKDARTWSCVAFTAEECADKLEAFYLDPIDDITMSLWPYVRIVRVYLRSAILQSGLILVDCPTSHNLDFTCARESERSLRNCDEILAVTTVDRALSDRSVWNEATQNGRYQPFSIVCTDSGDLNIRDIERRDLEVCLHVRTWRQQTEELRMQLKRCEAQRRHAMCGAIEEEIRVRDMLEEMEFGLKKFLVQRRNGQVATKLIELYTEHAQVGDLKVFCVSGRDYWEHRYDEQRRAVSRLELSGIVDLRKYCHSVASEVLFEDSAAFIEHDVPAFLGSLQQWAIGGTEQFTSEKSVEIRRIVKSLEELAIQKLVLPSAQIHTSKTKLNHEFTSSIVLPIREHRSEWRNAALELSKEWTKWDAKKYLSFCRQYGRPATAASDRDWNEELIAPMRHQLESNWRFFNETLDECHKDIISAIEDVFKELNAPLQDLIPSASTALHTLLSTMSHRAARITTLVRTSFSTLLEATQHLQSDALHGHLSSHINTLMAPAYQAASALSTSSPMRISNSTPPHSPSPSLLDQQRKELVTSHIASSRIFPKLSTMIEKKHRALVREAFDTIIEGITREVDALIRDLHLVVCVDGEKSEAQRYVEFARGLKDRVQKAQEVTAEGREVVAYVRIAYAEDVEVQDVEDLVEFR